MNKKENSKNLVKKMFLSISIMSFFASAGVENVNAMNESIFDEAKKGRADSKSKRNAVPVLASMTTLEAKQDNSGYRLAVPNSPSLHSKVGAEEDSLILKDLTKESGSKDDLTGSTFGCVIAKYATNKLDLLQELKNISAESEKDLAEKYIMLYGNNVLAEDARKQLLSSVPPYNKDIITGAAEYVVKTLFYKAKQAIYALDSVEECIRVANLLLMDAPKFLYAASLDNIGNILQAAKDMKSEREKMQNQQAQSYTVFSFSKQ